MTPLQYTIRGISPHTDQVLRQRARQTGRSFNTVAREALDSAAQGRTTPQPKRDLSWLYGAGKDLLGPEFDEIIKDQSRIEPEMWK